MIMLELKGDEVHVSVTVANIHLYVSPCHTGLCGRPNFKPLLCPCANLVNEFLLEGFIMAGYRRPSTKFTACPTLTELSAIHVSRVVHSSMQPNLRTAHVIAWARMCVHTRTCALCMDVPAFSSSCGCPSFL